MSKMGDLIYPTYFRGGILRIVNPEYERKKHLDSLKYLALLEGLREIAENNKIDIRRLSREIWIMVSSGLGDKGLPVSLEQIIPGGQR